MRLLKRQEGQSLVEEGVNNGYRDFGRFLRAKSMAGVSDDQLLTLIVSNNYAVGAAAFEALVRRHGPMVLATCRGVLRHEQDAEDAFQATFLVLARRAKSLRQRNRLGPWLHRIAVRASGQARSAAARRRDREARAAKRIDMVKPEQERDADREELTSVVHQEVGRLPEPFRLVVVLCELQGKSYEAAAASLGVPVGTVRSRLSRARERLRAQITRRGVLVPAGLAFLVGGRASAAVPSAKLIASTVGLAAPVTAGGFATLPAGVVAVPYAQRVLKASSLFVLGKATSAVAVAGIGLAVVSFGVAGTGAEKPQRPEPAVVNSVAPSPPEPLAKLSADSEWMQGRWVVLNAEQRGRKVDNLIDARFDVNGDRFHLTANGGDPEHTLSKETTSGTFSLEPTADPRRLELTGLGRTVRGLYRLDEHNQRLLLCLDHPDDAGFPREVASSPNSGQLLLVLRRDGLPGRQIELPAPVGDDAATPKNGSPP
jgi:RNA polymerase sigma factor (sigma-70 family)